MIIPTTFSENFTPDQVYIALQKLAALFEKDKQYTTLQVMEILEEKHRKKQPGHVWWPRVNRWIDAMVKQELLTYKEGYFYNHL